MVFVEISPPKKYAKPTIQPDEIQLSTRKMRGCRMIVLRFGEQALKRLRLKTGSEYAARWGIGDHQGKLRLNEVTKGWPLKMPKRGKTAQITLSRLPEQYEGREFQAKKITGEHIDGVLGRSDPFVQLILPSDFFAEPEDSDEQA
ncbi:hypothetical protein [Thalassospira sp.]|uniref:hypothetical protein n=1 Tax=Thalassospira sp. TaxID=1912094 RepID=UPI000C3FBD12|nr:hypothetical protein [Thalassospira sp.]MBC06330.1 hypothetical protein [Thalassospira sp.]|tara:strand:+ start:5284 stop:5718 length:435 start_codon:yes stop_codon:yes gene_type:complete